MIAVTTLQSARLVIVRCTLVTLPTDPTSIILLVRRDANLLNLVSIRAASRSCIIRGAVIAYTVCRNVMDLFGRVARGR